MAQTKTDLAVAAELKGKRGKNCNRTACQRPGAHYYSVWTKEWYCRSCAKLINDANRLDARHMYGVENCVFRPEELSEADRIKFTDRGYDIPKP